MVDILSGFSFTGWINQVSNLAVISNLIGCIDGRGIQIAECNE
jgi:hypothetical protein